MKRVPQRLASLAILCALAQGTGSTAFAAEDQPDPAIDPPTAAPETPSSTEKPKTLAAREVPLPAVPKVGDVTVSGYLRGGFGASSQKGRMTCFTLANPAGLVSKYRLGNECEIWSETHFTVVTYADEDGTVARLHIMPTVYIDTTFIGYSPNSTVNSPARESTNTGAFLAFPNLYIDISGISWLGGGTAWAGTRYYKRESVYISDFFYWNPSGVGAGIEDIHLGEDLRLSYAAFAVDGEPGAPPTPTSPPLPNQVDFGVRNDLQLRGLHPWSGGELQFGFQYIANYSNNPTTHSGWGGTIQFVQKLPGGDNKLALQYGRGGGTGFGTLARYYYPDFSVRHDPSEARFRAVDVLTVQPLDWLGGQAVIVFQHDDNFLASPGLKTDWFSAGARVSVALAKNLKLLGEVGYDTVKKSNGLERQFLGKGTIALAISPNRGLMTRPELRVFFTGAAWNETARTASVDSGKIYTGTNALRGEIFGVQGETWW